MTEASAYTLYWRDGSRNVVHGTDLADALSRAGFGAGSLPALDFCAIGEDAAYSWDSVQSRWKKVSE